MKILKVLFIVYLFFVISAQAKNWKLEAEIDSIVQNGTNLILEQKYDIADSVFKSLIAKHPNHPAGYLYCAAVMQAYSLDYETKINNIVFDSLLAIGKDKAQNLDYPWKEYFTAIADGYDAFEKVENGEWFAGVNKGLSSANLFEEIIEKDSSFYDAYIGLGTFYYWSSQKTAFLRWLPFVGDNRNLGIKMLELGASKSIYNKFTAISALIGIYLDNKNYIKLKYWSVVGLKHYPNNRIFLWGLATAYDRLNNYEEAVRLYKILLKNLINSKAPNPYNIIVCRLNLAKNLINQADTINAKECLKSILDFEKSSFPEKLQTRARSKFKEANDLLDKIKDK